jgi:hypothetical protein
MTKTYKTILMLVAVAVVTSAPLHAARVNNVELSHQDGVTIARVDVEGTIRFSHQTEIAKDGRPYRVILDVLSATHNLGAKNFLELPNSVVEHIRTSQYQVKPEKVVRLVFDMKGETPYRVQSDPKSVTLYFTDKSSPDFASWSSAAVVAAMNGQKSKPPSPAMAQAPTSQPAKAEPAKTVVEKNATIEKDRQASLSPATRAQTPSSETAPAKAAKNTTELAQSKQPYGPMLMAPADMPTQAPAKPTTSASSPSQTPVVAQNPQPKVESKQPPGKPTTTSSVTPPAPKKPVVASVPKKETPAQAAPSSSKEQPKAESKTQKPQSPTVAKADQQDAKAAMKSSTSRFRRNVDRKIKGTLVAQFPKRLVIKYKAAGRRDPFETLINDTKTVNNPIERRVANVDGLRMVGVIQGSDGANSALCEDKDNYGYILKAGDKVQKGYVLRVSGDRVYFQIFEYGWSRTVALNLEEY